MCSFFALHSVYTDGLKKDGMRKDYTCQNGYQWRVGGRFLCCCKFCNKIATVPDIPYYGLAGAAPSGGGKRCAFFFANQPSEPCDRVHGTYSDPLVHSHINTTFMRQTSIVQSNRTVTELALANRRLLNPNPIHHRCLLFS